MSPHLEGSLPQVPDPFVRGLRMLPCLVQIPLRSKDLAVARQGDVLSALHNPRRMN